jgi:transcriptional regulator with XRE-family HTH domain
VTDALRISFGRLCRDSRVLLDITQAELAASVGVSRSHIAGIETSKVNPSLDVVAKIGDALGLDLQLVGRRPVIIDPRSTSVVHSRSSGYVGRRFRQSGWLIRREVEVVHGHTHGWIDLVAFHPGTRTLVIVEIKTRLDDVGAIERQMAWYERAAPDVAARFGWRPTRALSWLLLLQSEEVEIAIRRDRDLLREAFPARADQMRVVIGSATSIAGGERGLALVDPSSRRSEWLIPSRSDGRRSPARYRDYADAARRMAS